MVTVEDIHHSKCNDPCGGSGEYACGGMDGDYLTLYSFSIDPEGTVLIEAEEIPGAKHLGCFNADTFLGNFDTVFTAMDMTNTVR